MKKPIVFISCGQYTKAEKQLGKAVAAMVHEQTGAEPFFAEEVQDLNGLDSNILNALRDCTGFIAIMHPRGRITTPEGREQVRASVWIEQEIAIATYIERIEKRALPVVAFIHSDIGLEGIRSLIHLNPVPFKSDADVLALLETKLKSWPELRTSGLSVDLVLTAFTYEQEHKIGNLDVVIVNDTSERIAQYNYMLRVPKEVLTHWNGSYIGEVRSGDPRYREFAGDEKNQGVIAPRSRKVLLSMHYCMRCGVDNFGDHRSVAEAVLGSSPFEATIWVNGKENSVKKTSKELAGFGCFS